MLSRDVQFVPQPSPPRRSFQIVRGSPQPANLVPLGGCTNRTGPFERRQLIFQGPPRAAVFSRSRSLADSATERGEPQSGSTTLQNFLAAEIEAASPNCGHSLFDVRLSGGLVRRPRNYLPMQRRPYRTVRHNAVRNVTYLCARDANMSPEREKANLLPARPPGDVWDADAPNDQQARRRRRPADVYLPRGVNGSPMALDFAATSGMQTGLLRQSADEPSSAIVAYEERKREFRPEGEPDTTEALCCQQGFSFVPMVVEAHGGGMGTQFRQVLDSIAKQTAAVTGLRSDFCSSLIAQRISVTLQRENARAILRRLSERPDDNAAWSTDGPAVLHAVPWQ